MNKPFSQACDNNKEPILDVLKSVFSDRARVLEIGSGTGQHAVHFARHLPRLIWQPSDVPQHLPGINSWLESGLLDNVLPPLSLDVDVMEAGALAPYAFDAVFTANTFHIMSWAQVCFCVRLISAVLPEGGVLCVYGPFNVKGMYTSDSNRAFDQMLQARDPLSGLRNLSDVIDVMLQFDLSVQDDVPMPANNRMLVFKKNTPSE
ncbi:MAG: DUF938 domain-containing protein [Pseudomonadota bacterium]